MPVRLTSILLFTMAFQGLAQAADATAGKMYFTEMCALCHSAEPNDGGGGQGPALLKLFGRPAATADEMFPYTKALKESKLVWNAQALDFFLTDPSKAVPGTAMPIPVPAKSDRENIIAYFLSLQPAP